MFNHFRTIIRKKIGKIPFLALGFMPPQHDKHRDRNRLIDIFLDLEPDPGLPFGNPDRDRDSHERHLRGNRRVHKQCV